MNIQQMIVLETVRNNKFFVLSLPGGANYDEAIDVVKEFGKQLEIMADAAKKQAEQNPVPTPDIGQGQ